MARQQVFTIDTTLYHPVEGARVFPCGETDPGPMWSDKPGGDRSETSMGSMAADLIAANDRADVLGGQLAAQAHDMAVTAAEATTAKEALAAMEQRAIAAETAQAESEELAAGYMKDRDAAREELAALKAPKPEKAAKEPAKAPDAT
jgi:hypothetical protein